MVRVRSFGSVLLFLFAAHVSAYAQQSDVLLQGFYWNTHPGDHSNGTDGIWWDSLRTVAQDLANAGFQTVWVPPPTKGSGGRWSMGYDLYDYYDLGTLDQHSSVRTRFGNFSELQAMMTEFDRVGLRTMVDAVLNHRFGGDSQTDVECVPGGGAPFQKYNLFNPASGRFPADATSFHPNFVHCDFDAPFHSDIFGQDMCYFNSTNNVLDGSAPNDGWYAGPHNLGHVGDSLVVWGRWLVQEMGFDEIRVDAIKHIEPGFMAPWLTELTDGDQPFVVGEFFDNSGNIANYHAQIQSFPTGSRSPSLSMFDFDLRFALKEVADGGGFYDMRNLNGTGLHLGSGMSAFDVVTFVENHDFDREGYVAADCEEAGAVRTGGTCVKLDREHDHAPVVSRKHLGYAYILAAEGRPMVFWKDVYWFGTGDDIRRMIPLRQATATGESVQMSLLNPTYTSGNEQDLWVMRRNGTGNGRDGALIVLNDNNGGEQEAFVDAPFADVMIQDYSDSYLFVTRRVFGDGRVNVKAQGGNYAWWARTGLYPQPPGEPASRFTLEAEPGGVLHYVVLRAEDAANLRVNGQPIQPGDEVAILGPSGVDVAGHGRVGARVRWDGVHDMLIEVLGNDAGLPTGTGRLQAGDDLQLVVYSKRFDEVYVPDDVTFASTGTAFTFSADRSGSRGGSAPFPLTTNAAGMYAVDGISLVTSFSTEIGAATAPIVDGHTTDDAYLELGRFVEPAEGRSFGDWGMHSLHASANDVMLYLALNGVAEDNGNEFFLFLDADTPTGAPAGVQLPASDDNSSPFAIFNPTLDFAADFGLRLTSGEGEAYVSLMDYRNGGNHDTYLGTVTSNGAPLLVTGGPFDGAVIAYDHAGTLTDHTGVEGWEIGFERSDLGLGDGDAIRVLALYGNQDFISAETIPQIPGQGATHLEGDPDFTTIDGDQFVGTEAVAVAVDAGWNLVGLPRATWNANAGFLFPDALDGTLFAYDGTYTAATTLAPGTGYWLRFGVDQTETVLGLPLDSLSVPLADGWNLVSGPACALALADADDAGGVVLANTLFGFAGSYAAADTLRPGAAYWLRTTGSGSLVLDCDAAPATAPFFAGATLDTDPRASFGRLHAADAAGFERTLYFGGTLPTAVDPRQYSLPPLPPGRAFDARFAHQSALAEVADFAATGSVEVVWQTPDLPLTLTLETRPDAAPQPYRLAVFAGEVLREEIALTEGASYVLDDPQVTHLRLVAPGAATHTQPTAVPLAFALEPNYPNPFNPTTTIRYALPEAAVVQLAVFDLLGRRVALLHDGPQAAGRHAVAWDATGVPSGTYFYRLTAGRHEATRRMILLK